jgi:putative methionine-R-sulfoxide reductase with GAF domain
MKRHADIGADLLSSVKFPYAVVPIVRHHHEHWDGTGYPTGISGTDIPLGARILSVVDCFDALTSDRPYRPKLSTDEAFAIIRARRGTTYDPLVVDTFIRSYREIAPLAIQAGQQAHSVVGIEDVAPRIEEQSLASLRHIRANASEAALLDLCSEAVSHATSQTAALEFSAQYLRQLTPATVYALFVYDATADVVTCTSAVGDGQRLLDGLTVRLGERITGWVAANRRASVNSDASLDLTRIAGFFLPPLRSTISAPIVKGERLIGVLTAYSPTEEPFNEGHLYALEHVALSVADRFASSHVSTSSKIVSFPKHTS